MFRVLFLMLILLVGFIAGPYISGKQGYVRILTDTLSIEMSITMLVVFFVIALALVYGIEWVITRFFRLSSGTYNWFSVRKRRKAQQQILQGFVKMDEGNYAKAEKLIGKNAKHSSEPILNFVKAAEAAQQRGDEFSANKYLIEATELAGPDNLIVELARTRILLQQNKLPTARTAVDSLLVLAPQNVEVLRLAVTIYLRSHAYSALDKLLPQIAKSGLYTGDGFKELYHQVLDGLLDEKMNEEGVEGLLNWWPDQPRSRRQDSYVIVGMIRRLIDSDDHQSAYQLVLENLKRIDNSDMSSFLAQVARLQVSNSEKLVKLLEKVSDKTDATGPIACGFARAKGYLLLRANQFDKAREAFAKVLAFEDKSVLEVQDYTVAAYLAEKAKDTVAAQQIRQQCLKDTMKIEDKSSLETSDLLSLEKK
ncbi:heme biosynthesis protein HemY [Gallibacterium salpingitidis]|uniref:Heme biosynthesis protein HemY n=1 Tax=Gallibacterium salpingitidis TaxID=505341 RepID=A0AB36E262_9PAST|nr:heme biosynthesis protein HemY [Gallibacterium salpingitidis]OBX05311.1 heme biosynthesis protein HemY [Gallibacterium salpingitidis]OBX10049.1 heme biosynthesis protein HemY [Gallibacterium salpingitidis]WKT00606.1 heme biosynthesis protein HemY [Gallibacterium salpingitidis]